MAMNLIGGATSGSAGGGLPGAPPRDYDPTYGGVPGTTNPIDLILQNMGGITGIQSQLTGNASNLLRNQYGGDYFALLGQLTRNAQNRAEGNIDDLLPEIWRENAAESAAQGLSPEAKWRQTQQYADIGLKRNEVMNRAEESMRNIFAGTPTVQPYDPTALMAALAQAGAMADVRGGEANPRLWAQLLERLARGGGGGGGGGAPQGVVPATIGNRGASAMSRPEDLLAKINAMGNFGVTIGAGTGEAPRSAGLPAQYGAWGTGAPGFTPPPMATGGQTGGFNPYTGGGPGYDPGSGPGGPSFFDEDFSPGFNPYTGGGPEYDPGSFASGDLGGPSYFFDDVPGFNGWDPSYETPAGPGGASSQDYDYWGNPMEYQGPGYGPGYEGQTGYEPAWWEQF